MKKSILFIAATLLLLSSCSKIDGDYTLKWGEVISDSQLSIKFKDFYDTRCPIGANCITAGEAWVDLEINSNGTNGLYSIGDGNSYPTTQEVGGYRLTFKSLTPHPENGVTIPNEDIRLLINVTEI